MSIHSKCRLTRYNKINNGKILVNSQSDEFIALWQHQSYPDHLLAWQTWKTVLKARIYCTVYLKLSCIMIKNGIKTLPVNKHLLYRANLHNFPMYIFLGMFFLIVYSVHIYAYTHIGSPYLQ